MAVPKMNIDIISGAVDPVTKKYRVAKEDEELLLRIIQDLEAVIEKEMGLKTEGPLRFIFPLAMRYTEQAGRVSFRRPKGNNPYNIMGKGVFRPDNQEYDRQGNVIDVPANFQGFSSDKEGVEAYFRALRLAHDGAWMGAWEAIRDVSSFDAFGKGLRPKGKPHYLTAPLHIHVAGLRGRAEESLKLLEVIYERRRTRAEEDQWSDEILYPALLHDPILGPGIAERIAATKQTIERAKRMAERIAATRKQLGFDG